jgi:hypothetical protein
MQIQQCLRKLIRSYVCYIRLQNFISAKLIIEQNLLKKFQNFYDLQKDFFETFRKNLKTKN